MSMSDPIADMLTRIRNAQQAHKASLTCPHSKLKCAVLEVMKNQGYIKGYEEVEVRQVLKIFVLSSYFSNEPVIRKFVVCRLQVVVCMFNQQRSQPILMVLASRSIYTQGCDVR